MNGGCKNAIADLWFFPLTLFFSIEDDDDDDEGGGSGRIDEIEWIVEREKTKMYIVSGECGVCVHMAGEPMPEQELAVKRIHTATATHTHNTSIDIRTKEKRKKHEKNSFSIHTSVTIPT